MIEINLLPEELRRARSREKVFSLNAIRETFASPDFKLGHLAAWLAAFLLFFQSIVMVSQILSRVRLNVLKAGYSKMSQKKQGVDSMKAEIESIARKAPSIDSVLRRDFSWTQKLNALSDSVTSGIWLTELSYNETPKEDKEPGKQAKALKAKKTLERSLTLSGYAYTAGEDPTASIGKFINALKANKNFYDGFGNISVESIKGDKFETQEVMSFKIVCSS